MLAIDPALQGKVEEALTLGFECFSAGDHDPFIVFAKDRGSGALIDLKTTDGAIDEALVDVGRHLIQEAFQSARFYVLVWDGYLTIDGQRQDAVFAEAGRTGGNTGFLFAQRYMQTKRGKISKVGKPLLVAEVPHLWLKSFRHPRRHDGLEPPSYRDAACHRLAQAARAVYDAHRSDIEQKKKAGRRHWKASDFIWEALLISAATLGNSRGSQLVKKEEFHSRVRWDALAKLSKNRRLTVLKRTLREASVRMPDIKAERLARNFQLIERRGSPETVKKDLVNTKGRNAKIAFLKQFEGIGNKYSRNMMMDAYHVDFLDSIAIDRRIRDILATIGKKDLTNYQKIESFLIDSARIAGIEPWELDRVLYSWKDEILKHLCQVLPAIQR